MNFGLNNVGLSDELFEIRILKVGGGDGNPGSNKFCPRRVGLAPQCKDYYRSSARFDCRRWL